MQNLTHHRTVKTLKDRILNLDKRSKRMINITYRSLYPQQGSPVSHQRGSWMCPITCLDAMREEKFPPLPVFDSVPFGPFELTDSAVFGPWHIHRPIYHVI